MRILVNIKNKILRVNCGDGSQNIKWLIDNSFYCYDESYGLSLNNPVGVKNEIGRILGLNDQINEILSDNQLVYIIFEDDFSNLNTNKKRLNKKNTINNNKKINK